MQKYNSRLIHQVHDEHGPIEVVESAGVRSLHFGTQHRQSSMSLLEPQNLYLAYVRAMMACLLFRDRVDDTLLIGLGGGSLAKFLLYHFSNSRIKTIECRRNVVTIARSHFSLPQDPRLKIIIDDGGQYLCQRKDTLQGRFGLLFVDAFDDTGISTAVHNEAFFDACKGMEQK